MDEFMSVKEKGVKGKRHKEQGKRQSAQAKGTRHKAQGKERYYKFEGVLV